MEPDISVRPSRKRIVWLGRFCNGLMVATLALTIGYVYTILARRLFAAPGKNSFSLSTNPIPFDRPSAPNVLRPTCPAKVYNRATGQWEVEKTDPAFSLVDRLKPPSPPAPPLLPTEKK